MDLIPKLLTNSAIYIYNGVLEYSIVKKKSRDLNTDLIHKLPTDVAMYIYKEFLEFDVVFREFESLIEKRESRELNMIFIRPLLPKILANKRLCLYLCEKLVAKDYKEGFRYFEIVYKNHKIENKKNFVGSTNGNSFALSLLMYLYH